jgi:hypothetical protein
VAIPSFEPPPQAMPPAEPEKPQAEPPPPEREFPADPVDPAPAPPIAKGGQAKGQAGAVTLRALIANPGQYLDEVVVPSDLLMVDSGAGFGGRDLEVRTKDGPYQGLPTPGGGFRIVLDAQIHNQLRSQIDSRTLVNGEYPAMMGLRISHAPGMPGSFVAKVEWLELLYYIDPRPIAGNLRIFKEVYSVVHMSLAGSSVGWSGHFKGWQERIQKATTTIRNQYDKSGKPPIYAEMGHQAKNPAGKGRIYHDWIKTHFR